MSKDDPIFNLEDDLFSFETDHLALKGNKDYCEVLKTLVILTAQREKALKDYKKVSELKNEALKDPFETLNKIRNGENFELPSLSELPKLPTIDLKKYNVSVPQSDLKEIYSDSPIKEEENLTADVKPSTTNQRAWSTEEQKRLEELLQIYPPEPIEMKRFEKIARALGNRTRFQVQSRVQKYFLKLFRAGLPIPGRIPKSVEKYRRSALHRHQKNNHLLWKPTSFFPEFNVPVQMDPSMDDVPGPSSRAVPGSSSLASSNSPSQPSTSSGNASNYLLQTEYHEKVEMPAALLKKDHKELQLDLLKRVRKEKLMDMGTDFSHYGYKCDYCEEEPIMGTRWHCATCKEAVDFCTDCVVSQMYSETCHPLTHWLVIYRGETPDLEGSRLYNSSSVQTSTTKSESKSRKSTSNFKDSFSESDGLAAGTVKSAKDDNRILTRNELSNLDQLLDECENYNSDSEIISD